MKQKTYKTTKKNLKVFKKEFMKWYRRFGLINVEVNFVHCNCEDALAWTEYDSVGMISRVALEKDWGCMKPTVKELKKAAFHECMELFLFPLRDCSYNRFTTKKEIDEEMHRAIRILEEAVLKGNKKCG